MPPNGMIISKLGLQASVDDNSLKGILCLKISIPKDVEARSTVKWPIFSNGNAPSITSTPTITPLPLTSIHTREHTIRTAAKLLSLIPESYSSPDSRSPKPLIEISRAGQVYVTLDVRSLRQSRDRENSGSGSSSGGSGKKEYLVILQIEHDVQIIGVGQKLDLPLPKCLDNTLRVQINPPEASSSQAEVSIISDPKILPLPASHFSPSIKGSRRRKDTLRVQESGWEDGEEGESDWDETDEEGGDWLEGRFQSTDLLKLEWSFSISSGIPYLDIRPIWHERTPSIQVNYEATIPSRFEIPIQLDIPDGWGWSEISFASPDLIGWRCVDGEKWDDELSSDSHFENHQNNGDHGAAAFDESNEDSFATIRGPRRPTSSSSSRRMITPSRSSAATLMNQAPLIEETSYQEFSFEKDDQDQLEPPTPKSLTPSLRGKSPSPLPPYSHAPDSNRELISLIRPTPAKEFELLFREVDVQGEQTFRFYGVLKPLTKWTLVSASIPVKIPVIRLEELGEDCSVFCPGIHDGSEETKKEMAAGTKLINLTDSGLSFSWTDQNGRIVQPDIQNTFFEGLVSVKINRGKENQICSISFDWPTSQRELSFAIPSKGVNIKKATLKGLRVASGVYSRNDGEVEIRLKRHGTASGIGEIVLEILEGQKVGDVLLPIMSGDGEMRVELVGEGWSDHLSSKPKTNLTVLSPTTFVAPLNQSNNLYLRYPSIFNRASGGSISNKTKGVWSWSTLINVFMLYLLLSLAQQISRLRSEISFVNDETKDLRMMSSKMEEMNLENIKRIQEYQQYQPPHSRFASDEHILTKMIPVGERQQDAHSDDLRNAEYQKWVTSRQNRWMPSDQGERKDMGHTTSIGRVVFGKNTWEGWSNHPTVRSIGKSIGWVWQAVVWLISA